MQIDAVRAMRRALTPALSRERERGLMQALSLSRERERGACSHLSLSRSRERAGVRVAPSLVHHRRPPFVRQRLPACQRFVAGPEAGCVAEVELGLGGLALQLQPDRQALLEGLRALGLIPSFASASGPTSASTAD